MTTLLQLRRHHILAITLTVAAVATCSLASAAETTVRIAPSADTYIQPYGNDDKNYGAAPELQIDQWGGRQALMRFPLADLPRGKRILRATLRLYIADVGFNEQGELPDLKTCVGLYDLATPWTEAGATFKTSDGRKPWSQGPGIGGPKYQDVGPLPKPDIGVHLRKPAIPFESPQAAVKHWIELDLTDFVRERQRAGDREVNLLLRNSVLGRNYSFRSREAKEEAERPQLAVTLSQNVPDFALTDVFLTDWKSGKSVSVTVKRTAKEGSFPRDRSWHFVRKPGASRLPDAALHAASAGAEFVPDAPGHYQVRCVAPLGASGETTSETADLYVLSVPPHPRMFITPQRLAVLRDQVKSGARLATALVKRIKAESGGAAEGKYSDFGWPGGCEDNALAYLLTGDAKYAQNSIAYAERILAKPMRSHFKDVHEAAFVGAGWVQAIALHYDWCYDQLTPPHRRAVADWLREATAWGFARAGRPIAHNDGGARQLMLVSAPAALLGDDPEAPAMLRRSRDDFEANMLPWLNDAGRGGRCGDGGEYEGLHGFFIVRYAWISHTATGEDVFSDSPFFANRLRHLMFGWYPRRLNYKDGSFSIRSYYSPCGDHIRLGYVGDTQPYQSAAALCDRYRDTPEAQGLRWLAGEWPTQWMQYCLKWAVLGDFDGVPAREPKALAYRDEGFHTLYARSDWSDDATWLLFENGPYVSGHQSLGHGGFEIFKGDLLAARTGNYDFANVGPPHGLNYQSRTIAGNCLLINDPQERWRGFIGGTEGGNDGGGERTNFPLTSGPDADTYRIFRPVFQRGEMTRFADNRELTYALADITDCYNSPQFHGGKLNRAKVSRVTRQLLYLRGLDTVAVFDRVSSTDPSFKKTWLLHSLGDLDVLDGKETKIDDGEFHYRGATRAVIRYGWPKPVPSFARCLSVTLLPAGAELVKIGGRVDLPSGKTEGFADHRWHGPHRHHHIKDFWVNGANYPPDQPPEVRWFGDPAEKGFIEGTPDESGGRGKWRLEVSPPTPAKDDAFFHVLCPRLGHDGPFPDVAPLAAAPFDGILVTEGNRAAAVFFAHAEERQTSFAAELPAGKTWLLVVADLAPGAYSVTAAGKSVGTFIVAEDGLLIAPLSGGGTVKAACELRHNRDLPEPS